MSAGRSPTGDIRYVVDDAGLDADAFLDLAQRVWPGDYDRNLIAVALGLFFGAQPGNEGFFEKLGYTKGVQSYARRKPRPRRRSA